MSVKVNKTGPWILHNNADIESLIDKLNSKLPPGTRVPVVRCNTADLPHAENSAGYSHMSSIQPVTMEQHLGPSNWPHILIPLGIGIRIGVTPLEWNGNSYPAVIDILGDFINISTPYLFKLEPDRVDVKTYTIITKEE